MRIKTSFPVILMLSMPAASTEHSDMKMSDMESSASSQAYVPSMDEMYEKMMAAVKEPDPDKAFVRDITTHHEGTIAMAETEFKYGRDPETRRLAGNAIKMQKGETDQVDKWLGNQKQGLSTLYTGRGFYIVSRIQGIC